MSSNLCFGELYKQIVESVPNADEVIARLKHENAELKTRVFELQTRLNEYHDFVEFERQERRRIAKMRRKLLGEPR